MKKLSILIVTVFMMLFLTVTPVLAGPPTTVTVGPWLEDGTLYNPDGTLYRIKGIRVKRPKMLPIKIKRCQFKHKTYRGIRLEAKLRGIKLKDVVRKIGINRHRLHDLCYNHLIKLSEGDVEKLSNLFNCSKEYMEFLILKYPTFEQIKEYKAQVNEPAKN